VFTVLFSVVSDLTVEMSSFRHSDFGIIAIEFRLGSSLYSLSDSLLTVFTPLFSSCCFGLLIMASKRLILVFTSDCVHICVCSRAHSVIGVDSDLNVGIDSFRHSDFGVIACLFKL
jgi:hypothetical protein